jgi:hypothetical protein
METGEIQAAGEVTEARREAERIEQLLEDVQAIAGRPAWQRVEELVQRLVRLYGGGLERVMGHLREAGRLDESLVARLAADDLVSSLLLLHDLHPWPAGERVRRALEQAGPQLRELVGELSVVAVEGDLVRLRLEGAPRGPVAGVPVERLLHRALMDAAPEIGRVEVEGLAPPGEPARPPALVQIDLRQTPRAPERP